MVAAAALVGGMVAYGTAQAGTVATSGDTNISVYGEVRTDFVWSKKMAEMPGWSNVAKKETTGTSAEKAQKNKTNFGATANLSTVGLELENEDIGVSGCIEAAFDEDNNVLNLKQAYLQHDFENYFVLIGKTDYLLTQEHASINDAGIAGINTTPGQVPQLRLGGEFDLGTVTLTPEIAVADVKDDEVVGDSAGPEEVGVNRTTMPGVAGKLTASIKTFFGEPINVYGGYSWEQVKLDASNKEKKKSPQVAIAGVSIPISWLTLSANYNYMKGATGFSGLDSTPPSYYVKTISGDVEEIKGHGWNIEANLTPIEQASIWAGYSEAKFKDISDLYTDGGFGNEEVVKKNSEYYIGASYALSEVTTISAEYDHFKTKWQTGAATSKKDKGDLYILSFSYAF